MTVKEKMLGVLMQQELGEALVVPLVEGEFAASVAGKEWTGEVTLEDHLYAAEVCGYAPIFEVPLEFGKYNPALRWKVEEIARGEGFIRRRSTLDTPCGTLSMVSEEKRHMHPFVIEPTLKTGAGYSAVEWYANEMRSCEEGIRQEVAETVRLVGDKGLIRIALGHPFELLCSTYPDILYSYHDDPEAHRHLAREILETEKFIIEIGLDEGAQLVYTAAVGTEMVSPHLFEAEFLPALREMKEVTKKNGGYLYYHSCGFVKKFIELNYYNDFEPDIFETLAGPPTGEITDLRWARSRLSSHICTKGNLDTELLRSGPLDRIVETTRSILRATSGYRHMVGLADTVLWGTPVAHVRAMVDAAREYSKEFHSWPGGGRTIPGSDTRRPS